ncbi:ankyrin repeat protein, putative [Trichomonas vaginalis G3]|uniref:Ankyrin repeat protein, putative n=1 Tax=Trichomonas vaginalis (strain ATCC PRA-98 / G3) TaxID=412133 RepID=A2E4Y7_TRIV3|nr:Ankyrin repeat family [Trichomonas vaginalis G3]EAY12326.1 ankyrin repeat protein, putative [Trichomonas vaginalis G3]KAI5552454.1 Ankyrin repeat family [Trichomonas vaginalis G3]|eukprot:XP_001324549.1 ankyrin repeat protein [Trichomonas vaginalis G3]
MSNDENTPLIFATRNNFFDTVRYLISVGANKEQKEDNRDTPIYLASYDDLVEDFKHLIFVGANKEPKKKYGITPLTTADILDLSNLIKQSYSVVHSILIHKNHRRTLCTKMGLLLLSDFVHSGISLH